MKDPKDHCPYCTQQIRVLQIFLNNSVVRLLRVGEKERVFSMKRIDDYLRPSTTNAQYFGLLTNEGENLRALTTKARRFLNEGLKLPAWVRIFDGEIVETSDHLISVEIADKVFDRFSYIPASQELLEKVRADSFPPKLF